MNQRTPFMLLGAALLAACGTDAAQRIDAPAPGAAVRFYNFAINAPGVNFYANDTAKITAIAASNSVEDTVGTKYSFLGNAGLYSGLAPGQYTFAARPASPSFNGAAIASSPASLSDGKYYSFYLSGFYDAAAKRADAFVIEDAFPTTIDFGISTVRFVNASPNSQPMQLYAKSTVTGVESPVGGAIAYKSATPFGSFVPAAYDLSVRLPGSSANLIIRTGVSFTAGRVYTVTARGDMTVTSSTATNRPFLDNAANR